MKFALILNSETYTPESYNGLITTKSSENFVVAVNSLEMAADKAKELSEAGYDFINLCGDFDDDMTTQIKAKAKSGTSIKNVCYTDEQMAAFEKLDNPNIYGFIFQDDDTDFMKDTIMLEGPEFTTVFTAAPDLAQSIEAANRMIANGVQFIELCGWYNLEKTEALIKGIDGKVPVGTAGRE